MTDHDAPSSFSARSEPGPANGNPASFTRLPINTPGHGWAVHRGYLLGLADSAPLRVRPSLERAAIAAADVGVALLFSVPPEPAWNAYIEAMTATSAALDRTTDPAPRAAFTRLPVEATREQWCEHTDRLARFAATSTEEVKTTLLAAVAAGLEMWMVAVVVEVDREQAYEHYVAAMQAAGDALDREETG